MNQRTRLLAFGLLVALGAGAIWFAWVAVPSPSAPMYGYHAWELDEHDGELVLRDESGGAWSATSYVVDEDIACLAKDDRRCGLELQSLEGGPNGTYVGGHRYVYHPNGTMYEIQGGPGRFSGYREVEPEEAFEELAVEPRQLTRTERAIVDGEMRVTNSPLPHADSVVAVDGRYVAFVRTGFDGVMCVGGPGDDFCERSEDRRQWLHGSSLAIGLLGALGVLVGAAGLVDQLWWRRDPS